MDPLAPNENDNIKILLEDAGGEQGGPKPKRTGKSVTLGGNNLDVNNKSYRNQLKKLRAINFKNNKFIPSFLAFTFAITKGTYGIDEKMFGVGPSWTASYNEYDKWGVRDIDLTEGLKLSNHLDYRNSNGFSYNGGFLGGSVMTSDGITTQKWQAGFMSSITKYDEQNRIVYRAGEINFFEFKAGWNGGVDVSLKLNLMQIGFSGAPLKGYEDESDHTALRLNIPDLPQ